ncbi:MAG: Maf family protein [Candidatus Omnitrophica bacterium]|nr:Maf family protein [Candidatus Omnitrophota bacterium]
MHIILASKSPRRKELFKKIVRRFTVAPSRVDETKIQEIDPVIFALQAAQEKACVVGKRYPHAIVVAADTIVALKSTIFGKPKNLLEAKKMLKRLSGTTHRVITAVTLYKHDNGKILNDYEITSVTFRKLKKEEIESYLKNGDFRDKAGSYAVQAIGDVFVEKIEGDYDNVVGLPTRKVRKLLKQFKRTLEADTR